MAHRDKTNRVKRNEHPSTPYHQRIHHFELDDWEGKSHQYEVSLHRASAGEDIVFELLGLMAGSLASVVTSIPWDEINDIKSLLDHSHVLKELDFAGAGQQLQDFFRSPGSKRMARSILSSTTRDGVDEAYTANYDEQLLAVLEVAKLNRFFPGYSVVSKQKGKRKK